MSTPYDGAVIARQVTDPIRGVVVSEFCRYVPAHGHRSSASVVVNTNECRVAAARPPWEPELHAARSPPPRGDRDHDSPACLAMRVPLHPRRGCSVSFTRSIGGIGETTMKLD